MRKAWIFLAIKFIADIIMINLSFILAYLIVFKTVSLLDLSIFSYYKVLFFITLFWLIIFNLAGLYKMQVDKTNRIDNIFAVSFGVFSAAFLTYIFIAFLHKEAFYSREIVVYASLIALLLINFSRHFIWKLHNHI